MAEPMKITKEMTDTRRAKVDEFVERANAEIAEAVENGKCSAYFPISDHYRSEAPYFDEVCAIFEREGYRIKPTGYIGGVWQVSYRIEW